jgi:putative protease
MIAHIPDLVSAGIDSFKVEGRMKTALYVAVCARTYRQAIDDYFKDPALYEKNLPLYEAEISKCTYRQYTTGFFYGKPSDAQIYDNSTYNKEYTYLGSIFGTNAEGLYGLTQKNKFSVGEEIEIMKPDGRNIPVRVLAIRNAAGEEVPDAPHPKEELWLTLSEMPDQGDMLRTGKE